MRITKYSLLTVLFLFLCIILSAGQINDSLKVRSIHSQQSQLAKSKSNSPEVAKRNIQIYKTYQRKSESQGTILIILLVMIVGVASILFVRYIEKRDLLKKLESKKQEVDQLNQVLNETNKQLSELVFTRDHFFSIIAHDLKSPFNSIIGFSEIIAEEADELSTEEVVEYANSIRDSSKNTLILLQNLLDWSRAQTGKILVEKESFQLLYTVEENFRLHKLAADKKNLELRNNVSKEIFVNADQSMITAVIRNLIGNAIKFTAAGNVIVDASNENGFVKVSVSDTGIGILPEHADKIFRNDSFYTTRGTENERGTGLGLILCKEFVEKNGGGISVESTIGKGSRFVFTIPRS
jgi:signal transduction histidine kinase